jgi:hypothetical protein
LQGGGVQSRGMHGSVGALLNREARSRTDQYVAVQEPTSIGRRGLESRHTWRLVVACSIACLFFMLVCGGTRSIGYRQRPLGPPQEVANLQVGLNFFLGG